MSKDNLRDTLLQEMAMVMFQHTMLSTALQHWRLVEDERHFNQLVKVLGLISDDVHKIPKGLSDYRQHVSHLALHIVDDMYTDIQNKLTLIHNGVIVTTPSDPVHVTKQTGSITTPGFSTKLYTYECVVHPDQNRNVKLHIPYTIYLKEDLLTKVRGMIDVDNTDDFVSVAELSPDKLAKVKEDATNVAKEIHETGSTLRKVSIVPHEEYDNDGDVVEDDEDEPEYKPIINHNHKNVA